MMGTKLKHTVLLDIKLQLRSGIPALYGVVALLFAAALHFIPAPWDRHIYPLLLGSEPTVMGFLFVGALISFEKDQGTLPPLGVSPLSIDQYIAAKVISLGLWGSLAGVVTSGFFLKNPAAVGWGALAVGMTSPFFTLAGIWLSLKFRTLSSYFIVSGGVDIPALAPYLLALVKIEGPWMYLFPTYPSYLMLTKAADKNPGGDIRFLMVELLPALLILIIWTAGAWLLARRSLKRSMAAMAGGAE